MSQPQVYDYGDDAKQTAEGGDLATLSNLARQQREAEIAVEAAEAVLKQAQSRLKDLAEHQIPLLMEKLQLKAVWTTDGFLVKLKKQLRISVPKERSNEACDWVENNGGADLVKRAFHIMFGRDEDGWANKFERDLRQRKKPLRVDRTKKVESSTLKAFLEGKLEAGTDVPLETFGGYFQKESIIELPKTR
jgi:hypothetical protein